MTSWYNTFITNGSKAPKLDIKVIAFDGDHIWAVGDKFSPLLNKVQNENISGVPSVYHKSVFSHHKSVISILVWLKARHPQCSNPSLAEKVSTKMSCPRLSPNNHKKWSPCFHHCVVFDSYST